jgi:WD40 repeat protein
VTGFAVAPDGSRAVVIRHGGAVESFDLVSRSWEPPWQEQVTGRPAQWAVAFSSDGKTVATANGNRTVKIWDAPAGRLRHTLGGHKGQVHAVAMAPDNTTVASEDGETVRLWDARTGNKTGSFQAQDGGGKFLSAIWALAFSPDGKLLAAGGNDGTVRLRDLAADREVFRLVQGHPVGALAFSSDGSRLASAGFGASVKVWDPASGAELAALNVDVERRQLAFQPGSTRLAIAGSRVILWDLPAGGGGPKSKD